MITLHGFASSNYYNVVKYVLQYKEVPHEEHLVYGGSEEWLSISPVGKIPALTMESGAHLSETVVICDYLEEVYPNKPLYPSSPEARAHVRQIMKVVELYLELPSRRLIPYAFSGVPAPDAVLTDVKHVVNRGITAMKQLSDFTPHIAGDQFTLADVYVHYCNAVVQGIGSKIMDWDILAEIPGMREWNRNMRESNIARGIEADRVANELEFHAYIFQYMAQGSPSDK